MTEVPSSPADNIIYADLPTLESLSDFSALEGGLREIVERLRAGCDGDDTVSAFQSGI